MYQAPLPTNHDPSPPHALPRQPPVAKEPFIANAIPAVHYGRDSVIYGDANSSSTRSFTPIKAVGDGSFGTVWLCDWHGPLPPNTAIPAMQSGTGARPEYANKTLVAVKRMKKKWENGWDECKRLKEIEALRAIPIHHNIIPLYDAFLLPDSKELYFVFEPMEGHLFQLIKARKGRPLAGGLVASIFRQIVSGLGHIHASGYFHRDMKPENVLVTTTGLHDYPNLSPNGGPVEKDVVAIIKLADFGLARETKSKPPYTEYVSTRWYRAPEVLLKCRHYSNPVDMWALGTIMAELVNLRPLFPGKNEYDQISKICEVLGDPSDEYGCDARGKSRGGGRWQQGIKLGKSVGFQFPKTQPKDINQLFDRNVPPRLVECIADLLKYEPSERLTSRQCLEHPYLVEAAARAAMPPTLTVSTSAPVLVSHRNGVPSPGGAALGVASRVLHPAQISSAPNGHVHAPNGSNRQSYYSTNSQPEWGDPQNAQVHQWAEGIHPSRHHQQHQSMSSASSYPSIQSPRDAQWLTQPDIQEMDVQTSPMAVEHPSRPPMEAEPMAEMTNVSKTGKLPILGGFRKGHSWRFFGNGDKAQQNGLPVVDEVDGIPGATSLKRTQSSSTDSHSLPDMGAQVMEPAPEPPRDPREVKREAKNMQREAERQRRALAEKNHREQARAVMEKRNALQSRSEFEWKYQHHAALLQPGQHEIVQQQQQHGYASGGGGRFDKGKGAAGPIRQPQAASMFSGSMRPYPDERMHKVRRRDFDDDHSIASSSDVQSIGPISFASVDSDPGPPGAVRPQLHPRPSMLGLDRGASSGATSPLTRQFDEFSMHSVRSTRSFEHQLANDFHLRASVDSGSLSDVGSPPVHALSLSPQHSWQTVTASASSPGGSASPDVVMAQPQPSRLYAPPRMVPSPLGYTHGGPSPAMNAPKSAINPIFKVPSLPSMKSGMPMFDRANAPPTPALPPFSQLEAIAMGEYSPMSPMAFTIPAEES